ncbi:MAG: nucleotide exchange factor GrpE [Polyangiaceae bacterium]|jgi:molecular chaperone GrpE
MQEESDSRAASAADETLAAADASSSTEVDGDSPTVGAKGGDPLVAAQAEVARLKDLWLRAVADTDNMRKRTRREVEEATRVGREEMLRALLPVFDNLERAIDSAGRSTDIKAVAEGLVMVERQVVSALEREGIKRVPTVGQSFDPAIHEAIQHMETSKHAPGTVLAEVQGGYRQGDRLVRAAMVIVAKAESEGSPSSGVTS